MPEVSSAKSMQQQQKQSLATDESTDNETSGTITVGLKLAGLKANNIEGAEGGDKRTKSGKFTLAQLRQTDGIVPLQYGTNQYDSQRGMTGFGMPRDVKGKHLKRIWELEFPEEVLDQSQQQQQQVLGQQQAQGPQQMQQQRRPAPPPTQPKSK